MPEKLEISSHMLEQWRLVPNAGASVRNLTYQIL